MRHLSAIALVVFATSLAAGGSALAQSTTGAPVATATAGAAQAGKPDEKIWSGSAALYGYFLPEDRDYLQPAVTADRGWLHLEGRFNYEDRDTASAWIGYNVSVGDTVTLEFTPMIGAVVGATDGVAPGYRATLAWRALELYSETEYVFDAGSADDFLYTWSELAVSPVEWFRAGLAVQRTKVYKTDFDIQRGVFVGFSYKKAAFSAYVFDPDADRPTVVLSLAMNF